MRYYWKNGFYVEGIGEIPEGAVELTEERYRELLEGQSAGKVIVADESGAPMLTEYPKRSLAELKEEACQELWQNYKAWQQKYVDAEDLTLAVVCANGGSQKGAAVQMWVMELWAQYYTVKDAITAAETAEALAAVDLTAEAFGAPPYTIRELNEEAAAVITAEK